MSIATELERIKAAIASSFTAIGSKGGTVPASKVVGNLESAINSIPTGIDTSDATAIASNILSGKTAYAKGSKITGSMPSVTAATPSISVSSSGLITASTSQGAGYVSSANKSATKQLTTQGAQTITPGTSNKTISSGRYLTGTQTIQGDSNLVASNIKKGVSIFGVSGAASNDISADIPSNTKVIVKATIGNFTNNKYTVVYIASYNGNTYSSYTEDELTDANADTKVVGLGFLAVYHPNKVLSVDVDGGRVVLVGTDTYDTYKMYVLIPSSTNVTIKVSERL